VKRDRRLRVLESALFSPDLSYAEKAFLAVVCTLRTEYVEGERRHGSRGMTPDGKFTLHLDYLAGALGTSKEGVRKVRRSLEARGALTEVHKATHGRPATWQAFVVRGAKNGSLTSGEKGTPYGFGEWLTRVAEKAPLTYRTTQGSDHAPTQGAPRTPVAGVIGSNKEQSDPTPSAEVTACPWHTWQTCPEDCRHADARRSS